MGSMLVLFSKVRATFRKKPRSLLFLPSGWSSQRQNYCYDALLCLTIGGLLVVTTGFVNELLELFISLGILTLAIALLAHHY